MDDEEISALLVCKDEQVKKLDSGSRQGSLNSPQLRVPANLETELADWQYLLGTPEDDAWVDWFGETGEEWADENRRLARLAEAGDDNALFKLIRRDARVLGSRLVVARVFQGRRILQASRDLSFLRMLKPSNSMKCGAREQIALREREWICRVNEAKRFLKHLGAAVASTGSRGDMRAGYLTSEVRNLQRLLRRRFERLWNAPVPQEVLECLGRSASRKEGSPLKDIPRVLRARLGKNARDRADARAVAAVEVLARQAFEPTEAVCRGVCILLESARGSFADAARAAVAQEFRMGERSLQSGRRGAIRR